MRRKLLLIPLACLLLLFFAHHTTKSFGFQLDAEADVDTSGSEEAADDGESSRQVPAHSAAKANGSGGHAMIEIYLSFGVLVFGTLVLLAEIGVMIKTNNYWDVWSFKVVGLTFVLVSGMFLVVAGFSEDQTAPMMGLLGTVAGYLLGKEAPADSGGDSGELEFVEEGEGI